MNDFKIKEVALDQGETIGWLIADALGEAAGVPSAITIMHAYKDLIGSIDDFDNKAPPNPIFLQHGFDNGRSPRTVKYLSGREYKKMGGTVLASAGTLGAQVTQVDVSGILMNSNATGSTLAHMKMLHGIAKKYPRSETIQGWVQICIKVKSFKACIRGTELASAAIPIGVVGITTSVAAGLARSGVTLNYGTVIGKVAQELHWRANVEMRLSGIGGRKTSTKANGPASAVMFEIFRRRCATRFLGQYDVANIISESGGWFALRDKLLLM